MISTGKLVAISPVLVVAASGIAVAETPGEHLMGPDHQQTMQPEQHPMGPSYMREMMRQCQGMMPMGGHAGMHADWTTPTMPGQHAFGAIQEVVRILEADPKTDWSKVDLEALRQHLVDMNEVMLKADAAAEPIDGGLQVTITGTGRTLVAIQWMVPAWATTMNGHQGWSTKAAVLPNGELLTVSATDPKEIQHIRGLGFIGLLASGSHHQMHHLAMAKGEFDGEHPDHTH
jgi:hypothetical protein